MEVVLVTQDCNKQPICHGGEKIIAELRYRDTSQRLVPISVNDEGEGSYTMSFTPDSPGNLSLSVLVQNEHIQGSPYKVNVFTFQPHSGVFHCCTFCSSGGSKNVICGCGGKMPGGYKGCGHGHVGHPGRRHWSCCGNVLQNSECNRPIVYQFSL
ncbi:hypothetical protein AAG570_001616 [Ranatra chinensis]|uniref:Tripartite motif-containing protein 45 n=1 Tax=Ranatra chinensis TaxID=642074 RepID=A0ABD0Y930_9HEMI